MSAAPFLRLTAFAAAMLLTVQPLAARAETLGQALARAYEYSGLLDQNRALLRAADEDVAQIVSELRPIINYTASLRRDFGKTRVNSVTRGRESNNLNVGVTLSLLLFDFGRTQLRKEAARETVLATREALRSIEQQVLLRAVQAYMNVLRTRELVSVRQNNLRLLRQELRAARDRFEVGEVTRTDVALAEARLASAEAGLASARGDLLQAEEEYRAATGDAPGQLRTPRNLPRLSGDVEAAKGLAVRKHPDMLQVQKEVLAAELTVGAAEASTRPRITLEGSLGAQDVIGNSDRSHTGRVGIELSGPIYQGGLLSSARRQAMAQRDAKRAELHVVRDAIMRDVGNAYAILRASYAARQAGQEQVRAARVAFRGIRQEATLGARTTLDVLDAEQELLDAQANLISAETDVYIAAYTVLSTIGELTARDLRLNVQLYDPEAYFNLVEDAPVAISPQGEKLDRVLRALGKQ